MCTHFACTPLADGQSVSYSGRLRIESAGTFSSERVGQTGPVPASEDFGSFGTAWNAPSAFWFVNGTDADTYAKGIRQNQ